MDALEQNRRICIVAARTIAILTPPSSAIPVLSIAHDLASSDSALRERVWVGVCGLSKLSSPRRVAGESQTVRPFHPRPLLRSRGFGSNLQGSVNCLPNRSISRSQETTLEDTVDSERTGQTASISGRFLYPLIFKERLEDLELRGATFGGEIPAQGGGVAKEKRFVEVESAPYGSVPAPVASCGDVFREA